MKKNDLKTELKKAKKVYIWSPESESKKESKIKLKPKKLKKARKVYNWTSETEAKKESKIKLKLKKLKKLKIKLKPKLKKAKKVYNWTSETEVKKDVFITRSEFSEIKPEILDEVNTYLTANKNNIIQARMKKDDKEFYEHLKNSGYSYINDQTNLLENLTKNQTQTVLKLILATHLILNRKELKISEVQKIAGVTRSMTDPIRKYFNLHGLKSVKSLKENLENNFRQITIEELKLQTQKIPKLLLTVSIKIFDDTLSKPNGLIADDLPLGFKLKIEYLAGSLIFYALNHCDFNELHPKYKLYTITEYINEFHPNDTTWKLAIQNVVPFLYDYLSDSLKVQISYFPIRGHDVNEEVKDRVSKLRENKSSNKFIESLKEYIKEYSKKLPHSDSMNQRAIRILEDAKSPPNKFCYTEKIVKKIWFGSAEELSPCFLFLAYNHLDSKCESLNLLEFSEKYFNEYKDALQTNVSFVFGYLSQVLREDINYTPQYTQKIFLEYTKDVFIEKLVEIKESNEKQGRIDNILLIDLILKTLDFSDYEFKNFTKNLSFIHNRGTPSRIVERLTNPDCFDKITKLEAFVKKYTKLIEKIAISKQEKKLLFNLLKEFNEKRLNYYNYEKKKILKKRREKERLQQYGDDFYSVLSRIKSFLLMLGFSPYDGYDIWENRITNSGECHMFANYHHYHYTPKDQSDDDLIFIPQRIPRKYEKSKQQPTLTHSMIAGKEGNLKMTNIKPETKIKIEKELDKIEHRIEHNASNLKEAVLTLNPQLLNNLIQWSAVSIDKAKKRLKDKKFKWANGLEKFIPIAKSNHRKKLNKNVVNKVIQEIIRQRNELKK